MVICTGRGDTNGGHCCWINGKVCEFLRLIGPGGGPPRCSIWDQMDTDMWRNSPVGRWFAERYPGFNCQDWPQNIPNVLGGLCCWTGKL